MIRHSPVAILRNKNAGRAFVNGCRRSPGDGIAALHEHAKGSAEVCGMNEGLKLSQFLRRPHGRRLAAMRIGKKAAEKTFLGIK
jgi:hypothetical protein